VKLRYWLLAISLLVAALTFWRNGTAFSANAPVVRAQLPNNAESPYIGAGSCSASACHNNQPSLGVAGSEYAIWATRDPHARAYESLFNEKSIAIQQALGSKIPSHEDGRCLKCHVSPQVDAPMPAHFKTDGVSCETCHGPARQWLDVHHLDSWKRRSAAEKQQFGMRDMNSVESRVKACTPCHVGSSHIDINHDLIAAGHPRLFFEFTAFHEHMPRHWSEEKNRIATDFEARAWIAGQLLTAHASLELLANRAGDAKKGWPEYAENDCASCHHDLQANRAKNLRKPGALSFGHAATFSPIAFDAFRGQQEVENAVVLRKTVQRLQRSIDLPGNAARDEVARDAKDASTQLRPFIDQWERQTSEPVELSAMLQRLLTATPGNSDEATQQILGLAAVQRSLIDRGKPLQPAWRDALAAIAEKMDRPRGFDPIAIQQRWLEFKRLNVRKGP